MKNKAESKSNLILPSSLQIRFEVSKSRLIIHLTVKETKATIRISHARGEAVWISREQRFVGDESEVLNKNLYDLKVYFLETFKSFWSYGDVTAEMLRENYFKDHAGTPEDTDEKLQMIEKKHDLLNQVQELIKNKPLRSQKIKDHELKLSKLNRRLELVEEKSKSVFYKKPRPIYVKKGGPKKRQLVPNGIKVRFIIRKSRINLDGTSTLECRVTVNGVQANLFSSKIKASPKDWDSKLQAISGNETDTAKLTSMREGLQAAYDEFRKRGRKPSPEEVIGRYFGDPLEFEKKWSMEDLIDRQLLELKRRGRTSATLMKYERVFTMFQEHNKIKLVEDIKKSHITEFWNWMKAKNYSQDYTNKSVQCLYGLFETALGNEIITHNPVKGLHYDWERKIDLTCLSEEELEKLTTTQWSDRLQKVVDSFLFMCYTGLHITDYINLDDSNVKMVRGTKFIEYDRQKTGQPAIIPLHPIAANLIKKYGSIAHLPRITGQKQNDYLKVIATFIKTDKKLTNKVARKTFTDMSINQRGMSFESVAAMLGHSSTKYVRVYGRVNHHRVLSEWKI